ncbi:disease resistance protein Roq1-like [Bidens hawaiensis]|uniref:disease resistance protein Roq1-like n=1 Tax=Bidens hawaiensis TaxID=980011 RepID=UPI00404AFB98
MDASLELLYYHAFRPNYPNEGYKEVFEKLANYCDGLPLALEVLGKILYKRDVDFWDATLEDLKKKPELKIGSVLQISFDSLSSENKELFKHIACFFVGKDREFTEIILNTRTGITHLVEKCLLSVKRDNKLAMHSLIQDMGRDFVHQESPEIIWKRSRIWRHEDSFKVLGKKRGTDYILGLALDMRMLENKTLLQSFELKKESFRKMDNLKLQLNYMQLNDQCFQNFPEELRWLCMHGFPSKSIYLNQPMENLVALDMSYSNIESFDIRSNIQPPAHRQKLVESSSKGRCLLGSLKILDLSFCEQLYSLGGFSELPTLERLIVRKCISLIEVCESVEQCVKLVHIDMSYCYKLKRFPISLGKLEHAQTLLLDGCDSLVSTFMTSLPRSLKTLSLINMNLLKESFPVEFNCLNKLEALYLDGNPIVSMPDCVRTLPRLQLLSMNNCLGLVSIEHPPCSLRELSIKCSNMPRKLMAWSKFNLWRC